MFLFKILLYTIFALSLNRSFSTGQNIAKDGTIFTNGISKTNGTDGGVDGEATTNGTETSAIPIDPPGPGGRCLEQPHTHCEPGFTFLEFQNGEGTCLMASQTRTDWNDARQDCRYGTKNTDLAVVSNEEINNYIQNLNRTEFGDKIWIGLVDSVLGLGELTWNFNVWPIGSKLQSFNYRQWAPGFPSGDNDTGECGYIDEEGWKLGNCTDSYSFVCQHRPDGEVEGRLYRPDLTIEPILKPNNLNLTEGFTIIVNCIFLEDRPFTDLSHHRLVVEGPYKDEIESTLLRPTLEGPLISNEVCIYMLIQRIKINVTKSLDKTTFLCLSSEYNQYVCPGFQNDCKQQGPFTVINQDLMPKLKVDYATEPATAFADEPLEAICKANDQTPWQFYIGWAVTIDGVNLNTSEFTVKAFTENATSILSIPNVKKSYNGMIISCHVVIGFSGSVGLCVNGSGQFCQQTPPITVIDRSIQHATLDLRVSYHKVPNIAYKGRRLKAVCTANVREAKRLIWAMILMGEVKFPQQNPNEYGVTINEDKTTKDNAGVLIRSTLVIKEITKDHQNLTLMCFSNKFDPSQDLTGGCPQDDHNCADSTPLSVMDEKKKEKYLGILEANKWLTIIASAVLIVSLMLVIVCLTKHQEAAREKQKSVLFVAQTSQKDLLQVPSPIMRQIEDLLAQNSTEVADGPGTDVDSVVMGSTIVYQEAGADGRVRRVAETIV